MLSAMTGSPNFRPELQGNAHMNNSFSYSDNWYPEHSPSTGDQDMLSANHYLLGPDWNHISTAATASPQESVYDFVDEIDHANWMSHAGFDNSHPVESHSSYDTTVGRTQSQRLKNYPSTTQNNPRISSSYPGTGVLQEAAFETDARHLDRGHLTVPRPEQESFEGMPRPDSPNKASQAGQPNAQYVTSRPAPQRRSRRNTRQPAKKRRRRNRVTCSYCQNTFSRQADVDRHIVTVHRRDQREQQGNLIDCPWAGCHRKGSRAFARKDHWLEHRRNFHGECLPKRRSRSRGRAHSGGSDDAARR